MLTNPWVIIENSDGKPIILQFEYNLYLILFRLRTMYLFATADRSMPSNVPSDSTNHFLSKVLLRICPRNGTQVSQLKIATQSRINKFSSWQFMSPPNEPQDDDKANPFSSIRHHQVTCFLESYIPIRINMCSKWRSSSKQKSSCYVNKRWKSNHFSES